MINLRISNAAKQRLASVLSTENGRNQLPALVWVGELNKKRGSWVLGFYSRDKIPTQEVLTIEGVEIVIAGPPAYLPTLVGKLLDFVEGQFVVT